VQLLSKLSHPHVIRLHEFFSDEEHLYIIMQYAAKGDLHQILKRRKIRRDMYSEEEVWAMAHQLLSALEYLHSRSVIHRDVKTLNIFVDTHSRLYVRFW
jgi:serine/threonine protein kinase